MSTDGARCQAWPFLIGRTRDHGQRVVVAPGFMTEPSDVVALGDATGRSPASFDAAVVREVAGLSAGPATAVFRSYLPRASQFGLGDEDMLLDGSGRPIKLTEGLVLRVPETQARKAVITPADLDRAHDAVTGAYQEYWSDGGSFTRRQSAPFTVVVPSMRPEPALNSASSAVPDPDPDEIPVVGVQQPLVRRGPRPARHRGRSIAVAVIVVVLAVIATAIVKKVLSRGSPAPQATPAQLLSSVCADLKTGDLGAAYDQTTVSYQHKNSESAFREDLLPGAAAKAGTCTYAVRTAGTSSAQAVLAISGATVPAASWRVTVTLQQDQPWRISAVRHTFLAPGPKPPVKPQAGLSHIHASSRPTRSPGR
jgi:hypothetical protein